ncbi:MULTISPECIES: TetR/AcrR family transcriptional regulator [Thermomonosporaceae]|uniref:TetR/AcrR family transcriptional regulator n=1 Tax=Thermomonosporaceae TaxID=2012 RepID=UPI00255A8DFF|nr:MULTISPECIES: TetR/AcrR family transcriptional regulator [Thermomonosporaceae]MDL4776809.1 TetR/AcrR family transcriptional regulator [Actinomadura xylanilytica]
MAQRRARGMGAEYEQRRAQIADAVLAIVADHGLGAVSQNRVAARAGVSAGRVQHYFPAKQQLIEAAFERGNALSEERIRELVGQDLQSAPARHVLTVVLTELLPYDRARRTHLRVRQAFSALALADEAIAARLRAEYAVLHNRLGALLAQDRATGTGTGGRQVAATREVAVRLVALTEGLAYYTLIGVSTADTARQQVLAAIAQACGEPD